MKTLRIAVAALILMTSASALAWVQATASGNGNKLHWTNPCVTYAINAQGTGVVPGCGGVPGDALTTIQKALSAWPAASQNGQVCTNFRYAYLGSTVRTDTGYDQNSAYNVNLVVWRHGKCTQAATDPCHASNTCGNVNNCWDHSGNAGDTIALTTTTYVVDTGEIVDADMEYFGWDGNSSTDLSTASGWYFTCSDSTTLCATYGASDCTYMDVQNTATHEAGHMLGLDHTPVQDATMFWSANPGDQNKRILSSDDIAGVCAIYPASNPPGSCNMDAKLLDVPPPSKKSGGCGYGSGSGGAAAAVAMLLGSLILRRRRAPYGLP